MTKLKQQMNTTLSANYQQSQQHEYERAIIIMLLAEKKTNTKSIIELLNEKMFINGTFKAFFKAIKNLFENKKSINVFSVCANMQTQDQVILLKELEKEYITSVNWEYYVNQLIENYLNRLIAEAVTIEDFKNIESEKIKYTSKNIMSSISENAEYTIVDYINRIETAIKTGYKDLDDVIGSFQGGDYIILAGATSMGKTCMALNLVKSIANQGKRVDIFSLEMNKIQIQNRIICSDLKIDSQKMRNFGLTEEEIKKIENYIETDFKKYKINICSDYRITIDDIERLIKKSEADIIFIDYLGLINPNSSKLKYEYISDISRSLKLIANEANKPIIALHQLSRATKERKEKRPQLSDLRDSGAIEQDADMVLFVYRPSYYDNKLSKDLMQLLIAKNRHGRNSVTVNFCYNAMYQRITDRIHTEDF